MDIVGDELAVGFGVKGGPHKTGGAVMEWRHAVVKVGDVADAFPGDETERRFIVRRAVPDGEDEALAFAGFDEA